MTEDSRPDPGQAICAEPNRNTDHREDCACIHPISRQDNYRSKDKPSDRGVVWKFSKRTVNVSENGNRNDQVNPAQNRTFGGGLHLIRCSRFWGSKTFGAEYYIAELLR